MNRVLAQGFLVVAFGVVVLGASDGCSESECPAAPPDEWPTIGDLRAAPEILEVDSLHFALQTDMLRNCIPGSCPPDCCPLRGLLCVCEQDSQYLPAGIHIAEAWIIYGDEVWRADYLRRVQTGAQFELQGYFQDGPKWGPEVYVDVVVRMGDGFGRSYLLGARDQWIIRVI